jgi:VanZ family protein
MRKPLSWLPAIIIMIMIYIFSSKPAAISGQSSLIVADYIYSAYENITGHVKVGAGRIDVLMILDHMVRKGAHITEYALLSLAIAWPLWISRFRLKGARLALITIGITVIYAVTDEYHQTFVPGRSGEIKDVLIDSIGACIGYLAFSIILAKYLKKSRKIQS